jgi:hypothetical protein
VGSVVLQAEGMAWWLQAAPESYTPPSAARRGSRAAAVPPPALWRGPSGAAKPSPAPLRLDPGSQMLPALLTLITSDNKLTTLFTTNDMTG